MYLANLSGFYWSLRLNKKTTERVFYPLQLCHLHLSRVSKVTFCDPRTFKLKFKYERTLLGSF